MVGIGDVIKVIFSLLLVVLGLFSVPYVASFFGSPVSIVVMVMTIVLGILFFLRSVA